VNDFLNTRTKAIPDTLAFLKNSILNQSEEPCRKDETINGMNQVTVRKIPTLLERKACESNSDFHGFPWTSWSTNSTLNALQELAEQGAAVSLWI